MWKVYKTVRTIAVNDKDLLYLKHDSTTLQKAYKYKFLAIFWLRLLAYWNADEELGMSGTDDKNIEIGYFIRYE